MNTCAEFLINDPRLGDPLWTKDMPQKAQEFSIAIMQLIHDAMVKKGLVASEVGGGKPWGGSCYFGTGKFRLSVFFYPVPCEKKKRWEGSIRIISAPPLWRRLPGIRNRLDEARMVQKVAEEMKLVISDFQSLSGVRWVSLQRICSSKGYEET